MHMHIYISLSNLYHVEKDLEGSVYWDELVEICSEILRAVGLRGAARFRGNAVCKEHTHEDVLYIIALYHTHIYCIPLNHMA